MYIYNIYIYISINKYSLSYLQTCMYNPHSSYETNPLLLLLLLLYIYIYMYIASNGFWNNPKEIK